MGNPRDRDARVVHARRGQQVYLGEADKSLGLGRPEVEDLGDCNVAYQEAARRHHLGGHAFGSINEQPVCLDDDRVARSPQVKDGVPAGWPPTSPGVGRHEIANCVGDMTLKAALNPRSRCRGDQLGELARHLRGSSPKPKNGVHDRFEVPSDK